MIPAIFNRGGDGLMVDYDVGDLVLMVQDHPGPGFSIGTVMGVRKPVYIVTDKRRSSVASSKWAVEVQAIDLNGLVSGSWCGAWFWPLNYLAGCIPAENYNDFWTDPYEVGDLVVMVQHDYAGTSGFPCAGDVLRVLDIIRFGAGCTVNVRRVNDGVEHKKLGAALFWPLAKVTPMRRQSTRDPRFPHECPKCKKPAYIGAFAAECSAACGIWTKP